MVKVAYILNLGSEVTTYQSVNRRMIGDFDTVEKETVGD